MRCYCPRRNNLSACGVALLLFWGVGETQARAAEFYYVTVFGAQRDALTPSLTHSFATFSRAVGSGPCAQNYRLESFTISWLPRTRECCAYRLLPEPGVNLGLCQTLKWAADNGMRVSAWGPYQIDKELYDRAWRQFVLLHNGEVEYKMLDAGFCSCRATNCSHAVSSVADGHRRQILSPGYGETAGYYLARRFCPWVVNPCHAHDWVYARLGLNASPILRRDIDEPPRSGPVWGLIKCALGCPDPHAIP